MRSGVFSAAHSRPRRVLLRQHVAVRSVGRIVDDQRRFCSHAEPRPALGVGRNRVEVFRAFTRRNAARAGELVGLDVVDQRDAIRVARPEDLSVGACGALPDEARPLTTQRHRTTSLTS